MSVSTASFGIVGARAGRQNLSAGALLGYADLSSIYLSSETTGDVLWTNAGNALRQNVNAPVCLFWMTVS